MKTEKPIVRGEPLTASFTNTWRAAAAGSVVLSAAIVALSLWAVTRAPADTTSGDHEIELAMKETWRVVTNVAPAQDLEGLQRDLVGAFTLLHPDLATRERAKDPAFVRAQIEALSTFFNPGAVDARVNQDPELRRQRDESFDKILHPKPRAVDTTGN